jgi:hypothetical protein
MDRKSELLDIKQAMLLSIFYDLVRNGEFVSVFAAEKIAYFLQRFGAQKHFNLVFGADFYGPYSGIVNMYISSINGSYLKGYDANCSDPFKELDLMMDSEKEVTEFLNLTKNSAIKKITFRTKSFLSGFYSTFGLEILSTIDNLMIERKQLSFDEIAEYIFENKNEKKTVFSNPRFINLAFEKLCQASMS